MHHRKGECPPTPFNTALQYDYLPIFMHVHLYLLTCTYVCHKLTKKWSTLYIYIRMLHILAYIRTHIHTSVYDIILHVSNSTSEHRKMSRTPVAWSNHTHHYVLDHS